MVTFERISYIAQIYIELDFDRGLSAYILYSLKLTIINVYVGSVKFPVNVLLVLVPKVPSNIG